MEKDDNFSFKKPSKKHICMNCGAIVSEEDEKCWMCGIKLPVYNNS